MTNRIDKAINIFLKAIEKGTLAKGSCAACAVGNLVAHGMNINRIDIDGICGDGTNWYTPIKKGYRGNPSYTDGLVEIASTDFTLEELQIIEETFEANTNIEHVDYDIVKKNHIRKDQIKGLEAVVEVMLDFDDCKDIVQEVFTSKAELIAL